MNTPDTQPKTPIVDAIDIEGAKLIHEQGNKGIVETAKKIFAAARNLETKLHATESERDEALTQARRLSDEEDEEVTRLKAELAAERQKRGEAEARFATVAAQLELEMQEPDYTELDTLRAQNAELSSLMDSLLRSLRKAGGYVAGAGGYTDALIATANATLSGQPAPSPWRPMSEAPKDGTEVILTNGFVSREGYFSTLFRALGGHWRLSSGGQFSPTGWMPLPPVAKEPLG